MHENGTHSRFSVTIQYEGNSISLLVSTMNVVEEAVQVVEAGTNREKENTRMKYERKKCVHGKRKEVCEECGGPSICVYKKMQNPVPGVPRFSILSPAIQNGEHHAVNAALSLSVNIIDKSTIAENAGLSLSVNTIDRSITAENAVLSLSVNTIDKSITASSVEL